MQRWNNIIDHIYDRFMPIVLLSRLHGDDHRGWGFTSNRAVMRPAGRARPLMDFSAAPAVLFVVLGMVVSSCTAQQPPVVDQFQRDNHKIEDELVDVSVAHERLMRNRNRAFGAGYLAIAPKIMCAGGREKVSITFVNFSQPLEVMLAVMENEEKSLAVTPLKVFTTPCGCLEIDLPAIAQSRMVVTLIMYARRSLMQCKEFEIVDRIKIFLDACNSETFIETDKPIYKAGQRVQFRVLTLKSDLRPDPSEVSKIWIESPSGIHMAQWLFIRTDDGLIEEFMPMSTDPPLGDWKIKVLHHGREFVQTFKVGEYVLPKFEVMINGPDYVVVPGGNEDIVVCGRYTHGQPVRGFITLHVFVSSRPEDEITQVATETDLQGCHSFEVNMRRLNLKSSFPSFLNDVSLVIKAEFTESATRVLLEESVNIMISKEPFKLEFSVPSTFKPGLPFSGMLLFKDPIGNPLAGEMAQIRVKVQQADLLREDVFSNDRGIAFFTISDVPTDAGDIHLMAHAANTRDIVRVNAQFSPSKSFIQIDPITERAEVNSYQTLTIHMTSEEPEYSGVYLHTVMMARGNILLSVDTIIPPEEIDAFRRPGKYGVYPVNTDEMGRKEYVHSLNMEASDIPVHLLEKGKIKTTHRKIKISYEMSPSVTIMAYYVRNNGEVVADTITVAVEEVFQNKVAVKFAEFEKQPGEKTNLNIQAKPSSLCAYGVVDKSVHLLGGDKRITKEKVFKALEDLQLSAEGDIAERKNKRCLGSGGYGQNDASKSFMDLGVVYLTNLNVETAPCQDIFSRPALLENRLPVAMEMSAVAMEAEPAQAEMTSAALEGSGAPEVRSYFPETWLYSLVRVGSDGHADIPVHVPHTITEWVGHGFCTSTRFGAGVSDLTSLKAFQPFFVDMSLPYSVIRNEHVPVTAVVFNYVTKCLAVKLTLQPSDDFTINENNRHEHVCVCGGQSVPVSFYVKAVTIDTIHIEVQAVSVLDSDDWCRGKEMDLSQNGFSDAIGKDLLVKPEGVETEQVVSAYFCPAEYPGGVYEEAVTLNDLPDNYVSGSERAIVTVTGDMLGPTISNLDHLLQVPTGCGEQNMIGFVPNILVMHYLTGINQLNVAVKTKAEENMKIGYQRQLNYRHTDGSYSAFGERDASGSTWLTAYVVRSFAQAKSYIYIDQEDLDKSIAWLKKLQMSDGCFQSVGSVVHKDMKGSVNDVTTLTAYVMVSLIEAGVPLDEELFKGAKSCLDENIDSASADMYTLALASYASILAGYSEKEDFLARLDQLAVVSDDGLRHWEGRTEPVPDDRPSYLHHQASSQHIEITSYVLLTYIRAYDRTNVLQMGNPIARWIVGQRNANGGFASTQDTVMALQALAEYGMMAYVDGQMDVSLKVKFSCELVDHWMYVRDHNRLLLQTLPVPQVPVQIKMQATGPGCIMTQVIVRYNVHPDEPAKPPFLIKFDHEEDPDYSPAPCSSYKLNVCAQYNWEDEFSNMAIVQVRMVSGFEPDANNLRMLRSVASPRSPKRIEVEGKDVVFYFDQLDHKDTCVEFTVRRDIFVREPRDGVITVFDNYEKALSSSMMYNFKCLNVA